MTKTILIADSGSTKTDWCLIGVSVSPVYMTTKGINPFYQTQDEIINDLTSSLLPDIQSVCEGSVPAVDEVYFYGAGCTKEKAPIVAEAISRTLFVRGHVDVESDMLGAARSLCQHDTGIVCILGTGSNSCFYNGTAITANVPPLGFILGDEGSGANLGKLLVGDLLKNQLTPGLKEQFLEQFHLSTADIIDRVYRQPFPNRFLASLQVFIEEHLDDPSVHRLAVGAFEAFIRRNVMLYAGYASLPVNFIGSIAFYYRAVLEEAAVNTGIHIGVIVKAPLDRLIQFHHA